MTSKLQRLATSLPGFDDTVCTSGQQQPLAEAVQLRHVQHSIGVTDGRPPLLARAVTATPVALHSLSDGDLLYDVDASSQPLAVADARPAAACGDEAKRASIQSL